MFMTASVQVYLYGWVANLHQYLNLSFIRAHSAFKYVGFIKTATERAGDQSGSSNILGHSKKTRFRCHKHGRSKAPSPWEEQKVAQTVSRHPAPPSRSLTLPTTTITNNIIITRQRVTARIRGVNWEVRTGQRWSDNGEPKRHVEHRTMTSLEFHGGRGEACSWEIVEEKMWRPTGWQTNQRLLLLTAYGEAREAFS